MTDSYFGCERGPSAPYPAGMTPLAPVDRSLLQDHGTPARARPAPLRPGSGQPPGEPPGGEAPARPVPGVRGGSETDVDRAAGRRADSAGRLRPGSRSNRGETAEAAPTGTAAATTAAAH